MAAQTSDSGLVHSSSTRTKSILTIDLTGGSAVVHTDLSSLELELDPSLPPLSERAIVRIFDLFVSATGLILTTPLSIAIAWAVRRDSEGPIGYRSRRLGRGSRPFGALKFRSMAVGSADRLGAILAADETLAEEYRRSFKLQQDPRITRTGRFLRKTNLDELPQLWNVLKGDMSAVGPRPKLIDEAELYGGAMSTVLRVKPGLTGRWQVSGRNHLSYEERIRIDVDYALNRTLAGDVEILWRTLIQMFRPSTNGAF